MSDQSVHSATLSATLCLALLHPAALPPHHLLQAAWCRFQNTGPDCILCLLQDAALAVHTQDGDAHLIPLPGRFTGMWPLPQGVLLTVRAAWHGQRRCVPASRLRLARQHRRAGSRSLSLRPMPSALTHAHPCPNPPPTPPPTHAGRRGARSLHPGAPAGEHPARGGGGRRRQLGRARGGGVVQPGGALPGHLQSGACVHACGGAIGTQCAHRLLRQLAQLHPLRSEPAVEVGARRQPLLAPTGAAARGGVERQHPAGTGLCGGDTYAVAGDAKDAHRAGALPARGCCNCRLQLCLFRTLVLTPLELCPHPGWPRSLHGWRVQWLPQPQQGCCTRSQGAVGQAHTPLSACGALGSATGGYKK